MTSIPSTTWQTLSQAPPAQPLPRGLDAFWDRLGGLIRRWRITSATFLKRADTVLAMESQFADLTDAKLREAVQAMHEVFRRGREKPADVDRAYAAIREVARRTVNMKPFKVQVAGAMAMSTGCIAEMATGEGKTLTATLPAVLAGWRGRGCHVVTANDYLAKRDAELMRPVYRFCGLRSAHVDGEMPTDDRREAYRAELTYCTNKEVAADFLRDRLAMGKLNTLPDALLEKIARGRGAGTDKLVQRGLFHAIVDEIDSILIDEAVTPLIISGQAPNSQQVETFAQAAELANSFRAGEHYKVDRRYREIELTAAGRDLLNEQADAMGGIWAGRRRREELTIQALTAREFYRNGKQYVLQDEKVVIVDEFTGRLMPDREWRDGLHQAVSAKEGVDIQPPKDTYARISFQRFFRLYRNLCGMTGTAVEGRREFWQIYHLPVVPIPTNRPCIRQVLPQQVYPTEQAKWAAIAADIRARHERGQPVLVGTRSVAASELLADLLSDQDMEVQVLNAVRHEEEAQVVAQAGHEGRITVATNMAGRGTDIKLARGVAEKGGLHVIMTERHEAGRVDRQLIGRCARQGDPGSCQSFVSLDDELVIQHTPHLAGVLRKRFGTRPRNIATLSTNRLFDTAQKKAEHRALQQRKSVLRNDDWLEEYLGFAGREL